MAEAIVEEHSQVPTRFYCHMCNVEISISNSDYTCPLCSGGFIEELPANAPAAASGSDLVSGSARSDREARNANRLSDLEAIRGEIATLLMSRNGPNVEISIDPGSRRANLLNLGSGAGGSSGSVSSNTGGGRVRQQTYDRLDNVLMDFLQSISGDADTPFGNSQMIFMGNPGDYAWGREGIDTIVTQLLNQMETSGPPPLAKDKIEEIPKVEITKEEEDKKIQCSVCWEDFRLQEIVRKLQCSHIYHENCIVPWLDLHGTCPICRKSLTGDEEMNTDIISGNSSELPTGSSNNTIIGLPARNRSLNSGVNHTDDTNNLTSGDGRSGGVVRNSIAPSTMQTAAGDSQTPHNNIFAFEDGNVDLD